MNWVEEGMEEVRKEFSHCSDCSGCGVAAGGWALMIVCFPDGEYEMRTAKQGLAGGGAWQRQRRGRERCISSIIRNTTDANYGCGCVWGAVVAPTPSHEHLHQ